MTMDCATFRNVKLAAPHALSSEAADHEHSCAACTVFARALDAFESRLQRAAEVSVPEGLAEQIILASRQQQPSARANVLQRFADLLTSRLGGGGIRFGPLVGAVAGALVLAVAGMLAINVGSDRDRLADTVIAHVAAEPEVLQARETVPPEQLSVAFARYGGRVQPSIGEVRHLGYCLMVNGILAQHVVVNTPYGPVTLILVPGQVLSSRPKTKDGLTAVLVPLRGGSMGIVTQSPQPIREVEQFVTSHVRVEG